MLRSLADSIEEAFTAPILPVSDAAHIAEMLGAGYVGPQVTDEGTFHYFLETTTGSTVALWDRDLSVPALRNSLNAARVRFGLAVQP